MHEANVWQKYKSNNLLLETVLGDKMFPKNSPKLSSLAFKHKRREHILRKHWILITMCA